MRESVRFRKQFLIEGIVLVKSDQLGSFIFMMNQISFYIRPDWIDSDHLIWFKYDMFMRITGIYH